MRYVLSFPREVVTDLIEEYKAAEQPDYVTWGGSSSGSAAACGDNSFL